MKKLLEKAINIASNAHLGQTDKIGDPYILHPLRVMQRMNSTLGMIVAVMHDCIEDTDVTFEQLIREGFPPSVIQPLDNVTKRKGEDYALFVQRAASHPVSLKVKMMDIEDNLSLWRQIRIQDDPKNDERVKKYRKHWLYLYEYAQSEHFPGNIEVV